jgi:hypothetical protein
MERRMIGFCAFLGGTIGSFVPAMWGGSEMGLASLLTALVGGVAGVFVGARIAGI